MTFSEVADGVHRLEHAFVNVYVVEQEGALLVVDTAAPVTLDPYTGRKGPQIVAGAATADSAQALHSLERLPPCDSGSTVLLPGHGEPWTGGVAAAVEQAREVGAH